MQKLLALAQESNYTTFQIRPMLMGLQQVPARSAWRLYEAGFVVSSLVIAFPSLLESGVDGRENV